ncbi:hypothetical protein UFOVP229_21 [uncultured Caudovirales phage]|uniref:Uncharacterized protein n=1 Tax=uncultured Caudovirales phage TaxID=2100421 RepID=A0A6J7WQP0_9CAUD|nr:hypothetical protein UFOVP229_21 [uncultured Caudovirales phage]
MLFTIGVGFIVAGWWLAWYWGDWKDLDSNWFDRVGGGLFGVGVGMCGASLIMAALRYLP